VKYARTGLTQGKSNTKRVYHPVYKCWQNMKQRCSNPKIPEYHRYGGRGVLVCSRWEVSANFIEDMLPTWFEGASLDRKDNDGPYSPENCTWIPLTENIRKSSRAHFIEFDGVSMTARQFWKYTNTRNSYQTIVRRVAKGLSPNQCLHETSYSLLKEN
jgi:hypothetical protein